MDEWSLFDTVTLSSMKMDGWALAVTLLFRNVRVVSRVVLKASISCPVDGVMTEVEVQAAARQRLTGCCTNRVILAALEVSRGRVFARLGVGPGTGRRSSDFKDGTDQSRLTR